MQGTRRCFGTAAALAPHSHCFGDYSIIRELHFRISENGFFERERFLALPGSEKFFEGRKIRVRKGAERCTSGMSFSGSNGRVGKEKCALRSRA
jgi:hypothetical protein